MLYLDDSGSPANKDEEYFVLGGVAVPEKSIRWLTYEIEKLALALNSTTPGIIEFHASEIFSATTPPWKTLLRTKQDKVGMIKKVLEVFERANSDITLFASAIHKKSFPNRDPVIMAYEDITSRYDMFLNRVDDTDKKNLGMVILDKSSYETGLQQLARNIRSQGNRWGYNLRNICEVPLFADSRASRLLQLADHIAYSVFRYYNAKDNNYFECIANRFDTVDGVVHGLSHQQPTNPQCMCPACLTRRIKT